MMKKAFVVFLSITFASLTAQAGADRNITTQVLNTSSIPTFTTHADLPLIESFSSIPLSFTANVGQYDAHIRFASRGGGCYMYFSQRGVTYLLGGNIASPSDLHGESATAPAPFAITVDYLNANPDAVMTGEGLLPGQSNYFIGDDWHTNVANYRQIRLKDVYDGIDLVYYGTQNSLKYDFIVQPGASPSRILLQYGLGEYGSDTSFTITGNGELVIPTPAGTVTECTPYFYQVINGCEHEVAGAYEIVDAESHNVTFHVADYDPSYPLVIDPELVFSTFLGGSNIDFGNALAIDDAGDIYVASYVYSSDFPVSAGALDGSFNGGTYDAAITKLNASGSEMIYSTYIGSSGNWDNINSIAIDDEGNAFLTGYACAADFPTTAGSYDESYNGGVGDAYVMKLNAAGNTLIYSTLFGGAVSDEGWGIKIDGDGNAYVGGTTTSQNLPTTVGAYDETFNGGVNDCFIVKLNTTGSDLIFSTFIGGSSGEDDTVDLALDANGNTFITGRTSAPNFPVTTGAYDESHNGGNDAYIAKLNAFGSSLVYSTFIGGSADERGFGIDIDGSGNAYITGPTASPNFPTTSSAWDATYNGSNDVFIAKLDPTGSSLLYSTYIGGNGDDIGFDVSVDDSGKAFVTGSTGSYDFPTTTGAYSNNIDGNTDAFILELNEAGSALEYSTYFGGSKDDSGRELVIDGSGNVVITGYTNSSSLPITTGAFDTSYNGGNGDGFVAKFSFTPVETVTKTLAQAYRDGLIGRYIYKWNNLLNRYEAPIDVRFSGLLASLQKYLLPYDTFWIQLESTDGVNIVFEEPDRDPLISPPLYPGIPDESDFETESYKFYTISFPVGNPQDYGDGGVVDLMRAWNGNLSRTEYDNLNWGITKYIYNYDSPPGQTDEEFRQSKFFYPGESPFDALFGDPGSFSPGQGYFFYHTFNPFILLLPPSDLQKPTGDVRLQLPWADPDGIGYTLHHVGNPHWVTLDLSSEVKIETPIDSTLPIGKVADGIAFADAEFWFIDIALRSPDGTETDEFNRAGVSTNYFGDDSSFKALNLVGPHDAFVLSVSNPFDVDQTGYSYDLRSLGEDTYVWELSLNTFLEETDAVLSLANLAIVPIDFSLTLEDVATGTVRNVTDDLDISVHLVSGTSKTFLLTATATPISVENESNEGGIAAFAIESAYPNPFNPTTIIEYSVDSMSDITISIYNINGQLVEQLYKGRVEAGHYSIVWNARGQASGTYLVVMQSGAIRTMRRITLVK